MLLQGEEQTIFKDEITIKKRENNKVNYDSFFLVYFFKNVQHKDFSEGHSF